MMRINLLPHRQIKRAERQRQFSGLLGFTGIVGATIIFAVYTLIGTQVSSQTERNKRLEEANTKIDKEIAEIKDLKDQIQDLLSRKQVVENLQTNRSQSVVVLDELSRKLPEGTYLKSIKQKDAQVDITGIADNNARIAGFVRSLSASEWLESPNLVEIKATTINGLKYNDFTLNVKLKAPQVDDKQEAQSANQPKKVTP